MTTERDALELIEELRQRLARDDRDIRAREALLELVGDQVPYDDIRRLAANLETAAYELPRRQLVPDVGDVLSRALLSCTGRSGSVLSEGQVCLLSAEGGIGKSAFVVSLALAVAMGDGIGEKKQLCGGVFDGYGGPVLYATYEDPPPVLKKMLNTLIEKWYPDNPSRHSEVLNKISLLNLSGWPLYGPELERGSYNSRPATLRGWTALWREAAEAGARLIILDPALAAYVGEPNAPAPVREFLAAITREAEQTGAGVFLLAHSTKAARNKMADPFDPGLVAGSGAWADGVRGVLTMGWDDEEPGKRVLRVPKANWGPSRISLGLEAIRNDETNAIVGFAAVGNWNNGSKPEAAIATAKNGRRSYDAGS